MLIVFKILSINYLIKKPASVPNSTKCAPPEKRKDLLAPKVWELRGICQAFMHFFQPFSPPYKFLPTTTIQRSTSNTIVAT